MYWHIGDKVLGNRGMEGMLLGVRNFKKTEAYFRLGQKTVE